MFPEPVAPGANGATLVGMPNPLDFLLDLLARRRNEWDSAEPLAPLFINDIARKHGVALPEWDISECDELEDDTASDLLQLLRTQLTTALVGEDSSAGREVLNQTLTDWHAVTHLEEELGSDELPGVEVEATRLPEIPLKPWYERDPALPRAVADRCPTLQPFIIAVASVLLTEATNIHLSGYAERVRACAAPDCNAPFIDAGDAGRRRFCSARCRARTSARERAWDQARARESALR